VHRQRPCQAVAQVCVRQAIFCHSTQTVLNQLLSPTHGYQHDMMLEFVRIGDAGLEVPPAGFNIVEITVGDTQSPLQEMHEYVFCGILYDHAATSVQPSRKTLNKLRQAWIWSQNIRWLATLSSVIALQTSRQRWLLLTEALSPSPLRVWVLASGLSPPTPVTDNQ
jgi:hypothetical protein